jgi:riboflavin synthase
MVPKGSVAIDGVSLTLVDASGGKFSVALIPTTLGETTLGDLKVGSAVNIETDIIGRYVKKYLQQLSPTGGLTIEKLRQAGFD